jgi:hypothetical protein
MNDEPKHSDRELHHLPWLDPKNRVRHHKFHCSHWNTTLDITSGRSGLVEQARQRKLRAIEAAKKKAEGKKEEAK